MMIILSSHAPPLYIFLSLLAQFLFLSFFFGCFFFWLKSGKAKRASCFDKIKCLTKRPRKAFRCVLLRPFCMVPSFLGVGISSKDKFKQLQVMAEKRRETAIPQRSILFGIEVTEALWVSIKEANQMKKYCHPFFGSST